jgi:NodT family efflux transporter outer membrane factor (OMF) lipoprotein
MALFSASDRRGLISRPVRVLCVSLIPALPMACAVGPDFESPKPPEVARYTAGSRVAKTESVESPRGAAQNFDAYKDVPAQWWTLFRSKPLSALIQRALKQSPDLQAASAALTTAREQVSAKEGSLFPALDASFAGRRQKTAGALFGNPGAGGSTFNLYNASVNVSYTLDVFGAIRREIEGLSAQAEYQQFQREGTYLALTANVVTSAVQEASLRAQAKLVEDLVADQSQQLETVKEQAMLGGASQVDVLSQQASLEQTRALLPPLQAQSEQQHHHLMILVGDPPGTESPALSLDDLHLPEALPLSLPSRLVRQRPDVRAQEALMHQASAQVGVATAKLLPDFTISASIGTIATRIGDLFVPGSGIWNTGLNLLQPVLHGGELIHKRRAALAALEEAGAQYRSTVLAALQNVADVLRALEADGRQLQVQQAAKQVTQEALTIAREQFQAGAISYLSLLDAERNDRQASIALVKVRASRYADTAALFQALGGGWWNQAQTTSEDNGSRENRDS